MTAVHIVPEEGIFKGKSDLVILDDDFTSYKKDVAQIIEFKATGWSDRSYPNSLLGVIAVIDKLYLMQIGIKNQPKLLKNTQSKINLFHSILA